MCIPKVTRSRLPVPWPVVTATVSGNTSLCSGISEIRAFRLQAESAQMDLGEGAWEHHDASVCLVEGETRSVWML